MQKCGSVATQNKIRSDWQNGYQTVTDKKHEKFKTEKHNRSPIFKTIEESAWSPRILPDGGLKQYDI